MAVYNKSLNLLFICEPHTASRAVSKYLLGMQGSIGIHPHHITVSEIREKHVLSKSSIERSHKFSVIRNIYDVLITHWIYNRETHESFHDWLRNRAHGLQQEVNGVDTLFWRSAGVDTQVEYPFLNPYLSKILRVGQVQLPKIGVTQGKKKWQTYYTKDDFYYVQERFPDVNKHFYLVEWEDGA